MERKLSSLTGFLVGGAVGWVLGTLYAPQPGRQTLDTLREKAIELRRRAGEATGHVREQVIGSLTSTEKGSEDTQ